MFGDIEAALTEHLASFGTTVVFRSIDFADHMPLLQINRIGGGNNGIDDFPVVSVESYTARDAENPRAGWQLASSVVDALNDTKGVLVGGCLIDEVSTDSGPTEIPWPTPEIQVYRTVYSLTVRG